jgi:hypothetical protein
VPRTTFTFSALPTTRSARTDQRPGRDQILRSPPTAHKPDNESRDHVMRPLADSLGLAIHGARLDKRAWHPSGHRCGVVTSRRQRETMPTLCQSCAASLLPHHDRQPQSCGRRAGSTAVLLWSLLWPCCGSVPPMWLPTADITHAVVLVALGRSGASPLSCSATDLSPPTAWCRSLMLCVNGASLRNRHSRHRKQDRRGISGTDHAGRVGVPVNISTVLTYFSFRLGRCHAGRCISELTNVVFTEKRVGALSRNRHSGKETSPVRRSDDQDRVSGVLAIAYTDHMIDIRDFYTVTSAAASTTRTTASSPYSAFQLACRTKNGCARHCRSNSFNVFFNRLRDASGDSER